MVTRSLALAADFFALAVDAVDFLALAVDFFALAADFFALAVDAVDFFALSGNSPCEAACVLSSHVPFGMSTGLNWKLSIH